MEINFETDETAVYISRYPSDNQGTHGMIRTPSGLELHTLELPWRDNSPNISCIPPGEYTVAPHTSSFFGKCFSIFPVPGRTHIRIHAGNWAGDKSLYYRSDTEGCILVGESVGHLYEQRALFRSRIALNRLLSDLDGARSHKLIIVNLI
jgi:hypothetical protein